MEVVAEGIETEAELDILRALGVETGQGFLLGRPGPIPRPVNGTWEWPMRNRPFGWVSLEHRQNRVHEPGHPGVEHAAERVPCGTPMRRSRHPLPSGAGPPRSPESRTGRSC